MTNYRIIIESNYNYNINKEVAFITLLLLLICKIYYILNGILTMSNFDNVINELSHVSISKIQQMVFNSQVHYKRIVALFAKLPQ